MSENKTTEEYVSAQERLMRFIRKNIYDFAIVLICLTRIVVSLADIQKTGKTIAGIIADGAITFVFSMVMSLLIEGKGLLAGEQAKEYQEALAIYKKTRDSASRWISKLDGWCKAYSKAHYKAKMTTMLLPLGLTYEQYVTHDYNEENFSDEQKKQYAKIKKVKVQRITTESLMSGEIESGREIDYENTTKKAYMKRSTSSDLLSKIILSIVFGYFTLPPIAQWDWSGAVWALLHTSLILGMSIVKYISAFNFVNDELRAKLVDKTNKLNLFMKEQAYEQVFEQGQAVQE